MSRFKPYSFSESEELKLTPANISKIIQYTTSRYNPSKKETVIDEAYRILLTGKGKRKVTVGTYTELPGKKAVYDYVIDGPSRTIKALDIDNKVVATYHFSASEKKPAPSSIKWKEGKTKLGKTYFIFKYNGYEAYVGPSGGKKTPYWVVTDVNGNITRDDVSTIEEAKKEAEKEFFRVYDRSF